MWQGSHIRFKEEFIMSMVVQHNLTAMNSNRQLGITSSSQSKSAEKLSSGYKINRAGDDAAGLKISEKMRSQIRGLNKASDNAQDGVSLIQTAEGALNETHSILQRMNELAVQGANDTNQSIDRDAINQELDALTEEIDRIASTTQFNKQELLNGGFTGKKLQVGANENQKITVNIAAMNAKAIGLASTKVAGTASYWTTNETVDNTKRTGSNELRVCIYNRTYNNTVLTKTTIDSISGKTSGYIVNGKNFAYTATGSAAAKKEYACMAAQGAQVYKVAGTKSITVKKANVDDYANAQGTITMVQNAINNVSSQRSALGALQNRLEHTIANLDNIAENTQSAESRIRDTDMAEEMVEYSKNNILAQAGQSMLAQANQSTQGVLSLLQ
jgi:flagellin